MEYSKKIANSDHIADQGINEAILEEEDIILISNLLQKFSEDGEYHDGLQDSEILERYNELFDIYELQIQNFDENTRGFENTLEGKAFEIDQLFQGTLGLEKEELLTPEEDAFF